MNIQAPTYRQLFINYAVRIAIVLAIGFMLLKFVMRNQFSPIGWGGNIQTVEDTFNMNAEMYYATAWGLYLTLAFMPKAVRVIWQWGDGSAYDIARRSFFLSLKGKPVSEKRTAIKQWRLENKPRYAALNRLRLWNEMRIHPYRAIRIAFSRSADIIFLSLGMQLIYSALPLNTANALTGTLLGGYIGLLMCKSLFIVIDDGDSLNDRSDAQILSTAPGAAFEVASTISRVQ